MVHPKRPCSSVQRSGVGVVRILGIVAKTHDSGVAILKDGVPQLVLEEERYNRVKKTNKFPRQALTAAFAELKLGIGDIDFITTPWDLRSLRRTFLGILGRRFPLSLTFLLPSSHTSQQNQIIFLNQAGKNPHEHICEGLELFAKEVTPEFHAAEVGHQDWKRKVLSKEIVLDEIDTQPFRDRFGHLKEVAPKSVAAE